MSTALATARPTAPYREPEVVPAAPGGRGRHIWAMPTDEAFLSAFLTDVFTNYWDRIIFGPIIDGAAYELACPREPSSAKVSGGYLTVSFGGPHFHICVGPTPGSASNPTPEETQRRRRPSQARIVRQLDQDGAPISWSFDMHNGEGIPMISIFFPSPFLVNHRIDGEPVWEQLDMWRDISARYLGREPEAFDASGKGYRRGGHG